MSETTTYDEAAAQAAGVVTEENLYVDYWGFADRQKHFLPDGKQFFVLQRMNEGQKSQYQRDTRSDVTIKRQTGDASLRADPATERHALIKSCVVDWSLKGRDSRTNEVIDLPFAKSGGQYSLSLWLEKADPKLVEDLEKACRKFNPWLLAEMKVEDIDREIDSLREMREEAVKREAGEAVSFSK